MNILIVLTSHDALGTTGYATGFSLEDFTAAYYAFLDAGADLTLASPLGGPPPVDPSSRSNGVHDEMIPVQNSYWLSANLPNAMLLTFPDSRHGSLFQYHDSFTRQAAAFLGSDSPSAPY